MIEPINDIPPYYGVGQHEEELAEMRDLYIFTKSKRVLEIGCWYGGTLREWLTQGYPDVVVAVDPDHRNASAYEEWRQPDTQLFVLHARSASVHPEIESFGSFDWVFIDGDHSMEGVRHDAELAREIITPGGWVLFHDIVAEGHPETPPRTVFEEMRKDRESLEFISDLPEWWPPENAHGIGAVRF